MVFTENFSSMDRNLLPEQGEVYYFGPILSKETSDFYFEALKDEVPWAHDELILFGKKRITKRKVAWSADKAFSYTYSNASKTASPWTPALKSIRELIEKTTQHRFNSCLLNLYHDGAEGMGWHSDNEKELERNGAIGSFSLGAERKFVFKNKKSKQKVSLILEHGSLLIMTGATQTFWKHCLPPTKKITSPRINLTFRSIVVDELL